MSVDVSNKPWELSLYELNREPQPLITDDTEIAVKPRSLHSELMCPICLDILRSTMTTKECLHRFCSNCITTALRSGNKECPTCRKKLVSRRSLRPDPNFDMLISKIYPEDYEKHQEMEKLDGSIKHTEEIEVILEPLPGDNSTRFLKTTTVATIDHLVKYISLRHFLESNENDNGKKELRGSFNIYRATGPGEYRPLPGQVTLEEVKNKFWKSDKPLELFYGYNVSPQ